MPGTLGRTENPMAQWAGLTGLDQHLAAVEEVRAETSGAWLLQGGPRPVGFAGNAEDVLIARMAPPCRRAVRGYWDRGLVPPAALGSPDPPGATGRTDPSQRGQPRWLDGPG